MSRNVSRRLGAATALTAAAMMLAAQPASAAAVELEAGVGCAFPLGLDGGAYPPERKSYTDADGNPIVVLSAGKSGSLTWSNLTTGESLSFPARGTRLRTSTQSDGTQLVEFSGNVGLVLFPTDDPAGPSTTQINGQLVMSFDPETGFTKVLKQTGHQIDVCAGLS